MAFVACGEDLFQGHVDSFPPGAPGLKTLDRGPATGPPQAQGGLSVCHDG